MVDKGLLLGYLISMMYKYTLNERLRHDLLEKKEGPRWWDTQWRNQVAFFMNLGADRRDIFSVLGHIRAFRCYYSKKELQFVPVGGWLIPVEYFGIEKLS